jgi:D-glycero-D-manno-heptose 1,7-bisphosphate phosphatase
MKKNTAVFLDRDGTINEEVGYMDNLDKLKIIPCAYEAIKLINKSGMKVVVISNQAGVARGLFTEEFLKGTNDYLHAILRQQGACIDRFYYCPHHPTEGKGPYRKICNCRKPAPGMMLQAAQDLNIDLTKSYIVGDRYNDMEAGKKIGVQGILVKTGFGEKLLQDDGPDVAGPQNQPDFIAADILEAVKWILSQVSSFD